MTENPYTAPDFEGSDSRQAGNRFPWLSWIAGVIGASCCWIGVTGMIQLQALGDPNSMIGDLDQIPIAQFVLEFFIEPGKQVNIASVASKTQFVFLILVAIGTLLIIGWIVGLYMAMARKKRLRAATVN